MSGIDDLIASFTARQHGLIARWQALGVGIDDHALDDRIARGLLVPVHAGVYRLRGVPFTQELRWLAAVLAGGDGARLSHQAAGAFHGYGIKRVRPAITVPYERDIDIPGVEVYRTRRPGDLIVVNRVPVTTRARTALDLAGVLAFDAFEELLVNAINEGLLRKEEMYAILDRRGGRGVTGVTSTRLALSGDLADEKIQKKLELIVARIVASANVPKPVRQQPFTCIDGREVLLDNAWLDRCIAVEAVGMRWHGNTAQARKSRARARSITASGIHLYEYGWSEATEAPNEMRAELESLFCEGSSGHRPENPSQNEEAA